MEFKNRVFGLLLSVILVCVGLPQTIRAEETSSEDAEQKSARRWNDEMARFRQWDAKNTFPSDAVLFVGSSSIRGWPTRELFPEFPVINRGFGGSIYSDIVHHIDTLVFPYNPRLIVFYSGDNDPFWGKTPEQVVADVSRVMTLLRRRLPKTPVIVMAVKISESRLNRADAYAATNTMLRQLAQDTERLYFFDSAALLLDADGQPDASCYKDDKLHLSDKGYRKWSDNLRPLIAALMAD